MSEGIYFTEKFTCSNCGNTYPIIEKSMMKAPVDCSGQCIYCSTTLVLSGCVPGCVPISDGLIDGPIDGVSAAAIWYYLLIFFVIAVGSSAINILVWWWTLGYDTYPLREIFEVMGIKVLGVLGI